MNYLASSLVIISIINNLFVYCSVGDADCDMFLRLSKQSDAAENVSGPLFLTPLIEQNLVEEAKKLAIVKPLLGDVRSYSGILTVNKTYNSNMFFWFFPAEINPETAPIAVWLAGVRTSSFQGLLAEIGPYRIIDNDTITLRNVSWTKTISVLFIDNPVGVGYSFTNSSQGYSTNEVDVGKNLYAALIQFYTLFPEFLKNELYIVGESYGGKHAPALGYEIHQRQNQPNSTDNVAPKLNLIGLIIFAGYCDPIRQFKYGDYLYQLGMVDAAGRDAFKSRENAAVAYLQQNKYAEAARQSFRLILSDGTGNNPSLFTKLTGLSDIGALNILRAYDPIFDDIKQFVKNTFVRNAIHVGNLTFASGVEAQGLFYDAVLSVVPQIQTLIEKYKFLFVGGQLDPIIPFAVWDDILASMEWSGVREYRNASRKIWKANGDVAGYVKSVNNTRLMFAWMRNAGHLIPMDQPSYVYELTQQFIFSKPLDLSDISE